MKEQLISELKTTWQNRTEGNALFISAAQKEGLPELRERLEQMVTALYAARYPYEAKRG